MKRFLSFLLVLCLSVLLLSWGALGHRTIGIIAERHLSPKAKAAVSSLLAGESLADASTWADEIRSDPAYRNAGPWHYINLPLGLNRGDFDRQVTGMSTSNIYEALGRMKRDLLSPRTSPEQKQVALKFLVHFVQDAHQPMHVSRKEDQGGNKVQVNFSGKGTNLHALWDSRLLERGGLNERELADKVDKASPAQVKQWQGEGVLQWLWESYGVSTKLYAEVEQMKNRTITDAYYQKHLSTVEERMEKAGIRLAGMLNRIFADGKVAGGAAAPAPKAPSGTQRVRSITLEQIGSHINEEVKVCGRVYGSKSFATMTLVNLGAAYPNQLLTLVLKGKVKDSWNGKDGSNICALGKVVIYKGKPQIGVDKKAQLEGVN